MFFAILLPPTIIFKKLKIPGYKAWPHLVHRSICFALNIKVKTIGAPLDGPPTLFVSNHVSWIDIVVLGHVMKACFIAKKDMIEWPVLGYLSTLQRTIFVNRERRTDVVAQRREMQERIHNGDNLILFPEGTTSDGGRVLPFKSALFGVTEKAMHLEVDDVTEVHHDHLIDVECGDVIEFYDDEIEELQKRIAKKYGYKLVDHRMELYGVKIK